MWRSLPATDDAHSASEQQKEQQGDAAGGGGAANPDMVAATDGVYPTASVETAKVKEFHRVAVFRCPSCRLLRFPHCAAHNQLLTRTVSDSEARCASCDESAREDRCSGCNAAVNELLWWVVSDDEGEYPRRAFPPGMESVAHIILQCEECGSVNFPGTEHCLTVRKVFFKKTQMNGGPFFPAFPHMYHYSSSAHEE